MSFVVEIAATDDLPQKIRIYIRACIKSVKDNESWRKDDARHA